MVCSLSGIVENLGVNSEGPHNFMRSLNLCDVPDVSKVAACGIVATGRLGRAGEIALMRSHNLCGPHNFY